ncbi:MAG: hypothetical protein K2X03_09510 [Bryobacteraceae bacterium]|nr:hypothetical protein [Bryobacteraceae bacterium]
MKTAVSRRANRSRSQHFLGESPDRQSGDEITEAMNRVIDATNDAPDPFTAAEAQRTLAQVEWY